MDDENFMENIYNSPRYNPYFKFNLDLIYLNSTLGENFVLINIMDDYIIPRGVEFEEKITNMDIFLAYKCDEDDEDCIIPIPQDETIVFNGSYNGFVLDHQNEDSPLYRKELEDGLTLSDIFYADEPIYIEYSWKWIKYKKEAGFTKLWNNLKGIDDEQQKTIGMTGNVKYFIF